MRKAASMIELVIAIVVMGIAVMSLPMILTQSQNSNALALQQEAIMATKARLAYILSYEWDAHSYDINSSVSRVLDTTNSSDAHDDFDVALIDTRRKGHVNADKRRRLRDSTDLERNATTFSNNTLQDLDDFSFSSYHDENASITAIDDYIFQVNLHSDVSFVDDGKDLGIDYDSTSTTFTFNKSPTKTNPTNIKMVTVTTTGDNINITMRAFASNIGESTILKKVWQ